MAVFIKTKPILTNRDLVSIQSIPSNDPRVLINVLATLIKKIVDWDGTAESITITDASGRQLGSLGNTINIVNCATAGFQRDTIPLGVTGTSGVTSLAGSGTLRKIGGVILSGPGSCTASLQSNRFAIPLPMMSAGVFHDDVKYRAARISGTGGSVGDFFLLEGLDLEFCGGLNLDVNVSVAGSGFIEIFTWYDLV